MQKSERGALGCLFSQRRLTRTRIAVTRSTSRMQKQRLKNNSSICILLSLSFSPPRTIERISGHLSRLRNTFAPSTLAPCFFFFYFLFFSFLLCIYAWPKGRTGSLRHRLRSKESFARSNERKTRKSIATPIADSTHNCILLNARVILAFRASNSLCFL